MVYARRGGEGDDLDFGDRFPDLPYAVERISGHVEVKDQDVGLLMSGNMLRLVAATPRSYHFEAASSAEYGPQTLQQGWMIIYERNGNAMHFD